MSQQIACEKHSLQFAVVKVLTGDHECVVCHAPAVKVVDISRTVADLPKQETKEIDLHKEALPSAWFQIFYKIPETHSHLRDELRHVLKMGHMYYMDGSVYWGAQSGGLDERIAKEIERIEAEMKTPHRHTRDGDLVTCDYTLMYLPGDYSEIAAARIKDRLISNMLTDLRAVDESMQKLAGQQRGEIPLDKTKRNGEEKDIDLLTVGATRIKVAEVTLQEIDSVLQNWQTTSPALEAEAQKIRHDFEKTLAYVNTVAQSFAKWASQKKRATA